MILKDLQVSYKILYGFTALRRFAATDQAYSSIEQDLHKRIKGFRGEKNVRYFLGLLDDDMCHIFFDLRLKWGEYSCQIDTLLLFPTYILIIEVKNFIGSLTFEKGTHQFIRSYSNKDEGFSNPIFQAQRHQSLLGKFLKDNGIYDFPIEYCVAFSDPATLLNTSSSDSDMLRKVIHAESILNYIEVINSKYKNNRIKPNFQRKVSNLLLEKHLPETLNSVSTTQEIKKGVICPACSQPGMLRRQGNWICTKCKSKDKFAHIQAILDLLLLKGNEISNKDCQDFLMLPNRRIVSFLLITMELPYTGKGKGRTYRIPSVDYFINHYFLTEEDRRKLT